ncbi:MAG: chromate reductase [Gammaproteobacteria bacterium]|jgi:chromate reductase
MKSGQKYLLSLVVREKGSFNQYLVTLAARGASEAGASVTQIDLADFPMPIFNQDLEREQGMREAAGRFKRLLIGHDAFLIASPEYNSAFSSLLKNAIDWASRQEAADEVSLIAYQGKTAAIMSAAGLGGLRGLVFLRMLLGNIGITVLPNQITVPHAHKAFNADGSLVDEVKQLAVFDLGRSLNATVDSLVS